MPMSKPARSDSIHLYFRISSSSSRTSSQNSLSASDSGASKSSGGVLVSGFLRACSCSIRAGRASLRNSMTSALRSICRGGLPASAGERVAAAKEAKSNSRLGQSGALSGFLLFTKINCTLVQFGEAQVDAPPERPQFPDLAPQGLVITNTNGVIALKLTCVGDPGESTIVRASAPASPGREVCRNYRILGTCPAAAAGSADITSLYTAKYGRSEERRVGKE